jgi:rhodanese-related sulfurtransferase
VPDYPAYPADVAYWLRADEAAVVDVDTSRRFRDGHVPGAVRALRTDLSRPELASRLRRPGRLVLTSSDGFLAAWAAADLGLPGTKVAVLAGGTQGWARAGRPLESGEGGMLSPAADAYRRPYEGTGVDLAVMQAYLDWGHGLVGQLHRDGTHGFTVLAPDREIRAPPGQDISTSG